MLAHLSIADRSKRRCRHQAHRTTSRNMAGGYLMLMGFERIWWSQTGSNRRPPACKAGALPAELWPLYLHGFCTCAIWQSARTGRFICQCAALVNPFLPILTVFSAAGSLSGKNHADSDQLRRDYRWQISPAHVPTSLPAEPKLDHWQNL